MPIREFARAKVNLALHVLGRRADGLHDLDSIVAFADIGDTLTFESSPRFAIEATGLFAGALPATGQNIIAKAWRALGDLPPVRIGLEKNLPVAAGLGGGSANAAATLRGLVRLFDLRVPNLMDLAMTLGSDVPVCLASATTRMQGAGERIMPLSGIGPFDAVLVNPQVQVSTAEVFKTMTPAPAGLLDLAQPATWRNDLTASATALAPAIGQVLAALGHWTTPRMSGSGATCFGLFKDEPRAMAAAEDIAASHPRWWVKKVRLGDVRARPVA